MLEFLKSLYRKCTGAAEADKPAKNFAKAHMPPVRSPADRRSSQAQPLRNPPPPPPPMRRATDRSSPDLSLMHPAHPMNPAGSFANSMASEPAHHRSEPDCTPHRSSFSDSSSNYSSDSSSSSSCSSDSSSSSSSGD